MLAWIKENYGSIILSLVLLGLIIFGFLKYLEANEDKYVLTTSPFNLRQEANTASEPLGETVVNQIYKINRRVQGEATVYGYHWYEIEDSSGNNAFLVASNSEQFLLNDEEYAKYLAMDLEIIPYTNLDDFQNTLDQFPESYHKSLILLHLIHPDWEFEALYHEDSWDETLAAQLEPEYRNLVQYQAGHEYLEQFAWMVKNNTPYDGSDWLPANEEAVAYYLDPRNFLDASSIFQFLNLEYFGDKSSEGVESIFADNESMLEFADIVHAAALEFDYLPEALAARVRQEASSDGDISLLAQGLIEPDNPPIISDSPSPGFLSIDEQIEQLEILETTGDLSEEQEEALTSLREGEIVYPEPDEKYFNFLNIGANPNQEIVSGTLVNGAKFARGDSENDRELLLPWTSPELAIRGGAKFLADEYLGFGQSTMYLQKFDLISGNYNHQYMQNVMAAYSESLYLSRIFRESGSEWEDLTFIIPVFENMPESSSP